MTADQGRTLKVRCEACTGHGYLYHPPWGIADTHPCELCGGMREMTLRQVNALVNSAGSLLCSPTFGPDEEWRTVWTIVPFDEARPNHLSSELLHTHHDPLQPRRRYGTPEAQP